MRKIIYFLFLFIITFISCDKNLNNKDDIVVCGVEDPLENLQWLKDMKSSMTNCSCQLSILEGIYNDQTVYYMVVSDPLCNSVFDIVLLDCEGEAVKIYKSDEIDIFSTEVERVRNIYTCSD